MISLEKWKDGKVEEWEERKRGTNSRVRKEGAKDAKGKTNLKHLQTSNQYYLLRFPKNRDRL